MRMVGTGCVTLHSPDHVDSVWEEGQQVGLQGPLYPAREADHLELEVFKRPSVQPLSPDRLVHKPPRTKDDLPFS